MYYDAHGRADPNGQFEMKDGKLIVKSGGYVRFDVTMMDSQSSGNRVFLRDAPGRVSDGARQTIVAKARRQHDLTTRFMGEGAPEFTEAHANAAIAAAIPRANPPIIKDAAATHKAQADAARRQRYARVSG